MVSDSYTLTAEEGARFLEINGEGNRAGVLEHLASDVPLEVTVGVRAYIADRSPSYHLSAFEEEDIERGSRDGRYGAGSCFKPRGKLTAEGAAYLAEITGSDVPGLSELERV